MSSLKFKEFSIDTRRTFSGTIIMMCMHPANERWLYIAIVSRWLGACIHKMIPAFHYYVHHMIYTVKSLIQGAPNPKNINVSRLVLQSVLEIPTGPPVRGRQLWRRTGNFMIIFLQFYASVLRFKPWGPTTFLTEFQTLLVVVFAQSIWCLLWSTPE